MRQENRANVFSKNDSMSKNRRIILTHRKSSICFHSELTSQFQTAY